MSHDDADEKDLDQSGPALDADEPEHDEADSQKAPKPEPPRPADDPLPADDPRHALLVDRDIHGTAARFVESSCGVQPQDAKDAVQRTLERALTRLHLFPTERHHFTGYLARSARNDQINEIRKEKAEREKRKKSKPPPALAVHRPFELTQFEFKQWIRVHVQGETDKATLERRVYEEIDGGEGALDADDSDERDDVDRAEQPDGAEGAVAARHARKATAAALAKRNQRFAAKYHALWIAAAVLLVAFAGWQLRHQMDPKLPIAKDDRTGPVPSGSDEPLPTPWTVERDAVALRDEGLAACAAGKTDVCREKVQRAVAMMPGLGTEPEVRAVLAGADGGPRGQASANPPTRRPAPAPQLPPVPLTEAERAQRRMDLQMQMDQSKTPAEGRRIQRELDALGDGGN